MVATPQVLDLEGADPEALAEPPSSSEILDDQGTTDFFEVESGAKSASSPGQDHHPNIWILVELDECLRKCIKHLGRDGIHPVRPIERNSCDMRFDFDEKFFHLLPRMQSGS